MLKAETCPEGPKQILQPRSALHVSTIVVVAALKTAWPLLNGRPTAAAAVHQVTLERFLSVSLVSELACTVRRHVHGQRSKCVPTANQEEREAGGRVCKRKRKVAGSNAATAKANSECFPDWLLPASQSSQHVQQTNTNVEAEQTALLRSSNAAATCLVQSAPAPARLCICSGVP